MDHTEVMGLSERHLPTKDVLVALDQHEIPVGGHGWYMETKLISTTGWGMGVEHFLAWALQHDDIRDMTAVPRIKGLSFAPW